MKIVIKIPEDTYKDIIKNGFIYDEDNEVVTHAIKNGTPLPKGHGELIDRSKLEYLKTAHDIRWYGMDALEGAKKIINSAPTIIEADKESDSK